MRTETIPTCYPEIHVPNRTAQDCRSWQTVYGGDPKKLVSMCIPKIAKKWSHEWTGPYGARGWASGQILPGYGPTPKAILGMIDRENREYPYNEMVEQLSKDGKRVLRAQVIDTSHLIDASFTHETEEWKDQISSATNTVLSDIAQAQMNHKPELYEDDGVARPVGILHGSMARGLFTTGTAEASIKAHNLLRSALDNLQEKLSPRARSVIGSTTGIYDMDIFHFPGFDSAQYFDQITHNTDVTIDGISKSADVLISDKDGTQTPCKAMLITLPNITVLKLKLSPIDGPEFSIDIAPNPRTKEERENDLRVGVRQSVKRTKGVVDVVASRSTSGEVNVGFSNNPRSTATKAQIFHEENSSIQKIEYKQPDQAILAILSMLRIELFSTAGDRQPAIDVDTLAKSSIEMVWTAINIASRSGKSEVISPYRNEEVTRECLVMLGANKDYFLDLFVRMHFDKYFANTDDIRYLRSMTQDEFDHRFSTDPDFCSYICDSFDITGVHNRNFDYCPYSKLTPEGMRSATREARDSTVHSIKERSEMGLSKTPLPDDYEHWVVQNDRDGDGRTQIELEELQARFPKLATVAFFPKRGLAGFVMYKEGKNINRRSGEQHIRELSLRIRKIDFAKANSLYHESADLAHPSNPLFHLPYAVNIYHERFGNPIYLDRIQGSGMPTLIIDMYEANMSGGRIVVITHPDILSPEQCKDATRKEMEEWVQDTYAYLLGNDRQSQEEQTYDDLPS